MSNLTKITDDLLAVEVPTNSENLDYDNAIIYFDLPTGILEKSIELGVSRLDKYEILGTVSETEIDFDCEPYTNATGLMAEYWFRNTLKSKGITPTPETKIVILKKI